jgi:hypothetical protein
MVIRRQMPTEMMPRLRKTIQLSGSPMQAPGMFSTVAPTITALWPLPIPGPRTPMWMYPPTWKLDKPTWRSSPTVLRRPDTRLESDRGFEASEKKHLAGVAFLAEERGAVPIKAVHQPWFLRSVPLRRPWVSTMDLSYQVVDVQRIPGCGNGRSNLLPASPDCSVPRSAPAIGLESP